MAFIPNPVVTTLRAPRFSVATITTGTGSSTFVTLLAGSTTGTKVFEMMATATTTQQADLNWGVLNTTSSYTQVGTVSMLAFGGSVSSVNGVNLMANAQVPFLNTQQQIYLLSTADSIVVKSPVALASGQIYLTAQSADF